MKPRLFFTKSIALAVVISFISTGILPPNGIPSTGAVLSVEQLSHARPTPVANVLSRSELREALKVSELLSASLSQVTRHKSQLISSDLRHVTSEHSSRSELRSEEPSKQGPKAKIPNAEQVIQDFDEEFYDEIMNPIKTSLEPGAAVVADLVLKIRALGRAVFALNPDQKADAIEALNYLTYTEHLPKEVMDEILVSLGRVYSGCNDWFKARIIELLSPKAKAGDRAALEAIGRLIESSANEISWPEEQVLYDILKVQLEKGASGAIWGVAYAYRNLTADQKKEILPILIEKAKENINEGYPALVHVIEFLPEDFRITVLQTLFVMASYPNEASSRPISNRALEALGVVYGYAKKSKMKSVEPNSNISLSRAIRHLLFKQADHVDYPGAVLGLAYVYPFLDSDLQNKVYARLSVKGSKGNSYVLIVLAMIYAKAKTQAPSGGAIDMERVFQFAAGKGEFPKIFGHASGSAGKHGAVPASSPISNAAEIIQDFEEKFLGELVKHDNNPGFFPALGVAASSLDNPKQVEMAEDQLLGSYEMLRQGALEEGADPSVDDILMALATGFDSFNSKTQDEVAGLLFDYATGGNGAALVALGYVYRHFLQEGLFYEVLKQEAQEKNPHALFALAYAFDQLTPDQQKEVSPLIRSSPFRIYIEPTKEVFLFEEYPESIKTSFVNMLSVSRDEIGGSPEAFRIFGKWYSEFLKMDPVKSQKVYSFMFDMVKKDNTISVLMMLVFAFQHLMPDQQKEVYAKLKSFAEQGNPDALYGLAVLYSEAKKSFGKAQTAFNDGDKFQHGALSKEMAKGWTAVKDPATGAITKIVIPDEAMADFEKKFPAAVESGSSPISNAAEVIKDYEEIFYPQLTAQGKEGYEPADALVLPTLVEEQKTSYMAEDAEEFFEKEFDDFTDNEWIGFAMTLASGVGDTATLKDGKSFAPFLYQQIAKAAVKRKPGALLGLGFVLKAIPNLSFGGADKKTIANEIYEILKAKAENGSVHALFALAYGYNLLSVPQLYEVIKLIQNNSSGHIRTALMRHIAPAGVWLNDSAADVYEDLAELAKATGTPEAYRIFATAYVEAQAKNYHMKSKMEAHLTGSNEAFIVPVLLVFGFAYRHLSAPLQKEIYGKLKALAATGDPDALYVLSDIYVQAKKQQTAPPQQIVNITGINPGGETAFNVLSQSFPEGAKQTSETEAGGEPAKLVIPETPDVHPSDYSFEYAGGKLKLMRYKVLSDQAPSKASPEAQRIMNQYEEFENVNNEVLSLLNKQEKTIGDFYQLLKKMQEMVEIYLILFKGVEKGTSLQSVANDPSDLIGGRTIAEIYLRIQEELNDKLQQTSSKIVTTVLLPAAVEEILQRFDSRKTTELIGQGAEHYSQAQKDSVSFAELVNIVHQKGIRNLSDMISKIPDARREMNVDVVDEEVKTKGHASTHPAISISYLDASAHPSAEGPLPVEYVARAFAKRTQIHHNDRQFNLGNAMIVSNGKRAIVGMHLGLHSARIQFALLAPQEGGRVTINYTDSGSTYAPGSDIRIKAIANALRSVGFKVNHSGYHLDAYFDKDSGANSINQLPDKLEFAIQLLTNTYDLDLKLKPAVLGGQMTRDEALQKLTERFVVDGFIVREGLEFGAGTFSPKVPEAMRDGFSRLAEVLGVPVPAQLGQRFLDQLSERASLLLSRGAVIIQDGKLVKNPDYEKSEVSPIQWLLFMLVLADIQGALKEPRQMAAIAESMKHLAARRTIGTVGQYEVEELRLPLLGDQVVFYVLKDAKTSMFRLARVALGDRPRNISRYDRFRHVSLKDNSIGLNELAAIMSRQQLGRTSHLKTWLESLGFQASGESDIFTLVQSDDFLNKTVPAFDFDKTLETSRGVEAVSPISLGGVPIQKGSALGRAVLKAEAKAPDDFKGGILIADYTEPKDEPGIDSSNGIVVTTGGTLSHAAIRAQQKGKPAVILNGAAYAPDAMSFAYFKGVQVRREQTINEKKVVYYELSDYGEETIAVRHGDLVYLDANTGMFYFIASRTDEQAIAWYGQYQDWKKNVGTLIQESSVDELIDLLKHIQNENLLRAIILDLLQNPNLASGQLERVFESAVSLGSNKEVLTGFLRSRALAQLEEFQKTYEDDMASLRTFHDVEQLYLIVTDISERAMEVERAIRVANGNWNESVKPETIQQMAQTFFEKARTYLTAYREALVKQMKQEKAGEKKLARLLRLSARLSVAGLSMETVRPDLFQEMQEILAAEKARREAKNGARILPKSEIENRHYRELVGGKAAHSGELEHALRVLKDGGFIAEQIVTADGFAISVAMHEKWLANSKTLDEEDKTKIAIAYRNLVLNQRASLLRFLEKDERSEDPFKVNVRKFLDKLARLDKVESPEMFDLLISIAREAFRVLLEHAPEHVSRSLKHRMQVFGAVAVRSSGLKEDSVTDAMAGMKKSVINVAGLEAIDRAMEEVWGSGAEGILIDEMVNSKISGVVFSADSVSKRTDRVRIISAPGLGKGLVDAKEGVKDPDTFVFSKQPDGSFAPLPNESRIGAKEQMVVLDLEKGGTKTVSLEPDSAEAKEKKALPSLSDEQLEILVRAVVALSGYFGFQVDVEFAIDSDDRIVILQLRPITTLTSAITKAHAILAGPNEIKPEEGARSELRLTKSILSFPNDFIGDDNNSRSELRSELRFFTRSELRSATHVAEPPFKSRPDSSRIGIPRSISNGDGVEAKRSELRQIDLSREKRVLVMTENVPAFDHYLWQTAGKKRYVRLRVGDEKELQRLKTDLEILPDGTEKRNPGSLAQVIQEGGILLLDAKDADPKAIESFNSLFDDSRSWEGYSAHPDLQVFVALPKDQMGNFANTLYSRSLVVGEADLHWKKFEDPVEFLRKETLAKDKEAPRGALVIDLKKSPRYRDHLLGKLSLDSQSGKPLFVGDGREDNGRVYGVLIQAIREDRPLVIQGAPWDDQGFCDLIRDVLEKNRIRINGNDLEIPKKKFRLLTQDKDYAEGTQDKKIFRPERPSQNDGELWVINSTTQDMLFSTVKVSPQGRLVEFPGLLSQAKKLRLRITESLADGIWHEILHSPSITEIEVERGVPIPHEYQSLAANDQAVDDQARPVPTTGKVTIIEGEDPAYVHEKIWRGVKPGKEVVFYPVSRETKQSQLFESIEYRTSPEGEKVYEIKEQQILQNLKSGTVVVLEGIERNPYLMKRLAGLLTEDPYLVLNGEHHRLTEFPGSFILTRKSSRHLSAYSRSRRIDVDNPKIEYKGILEREFPGLVSEEDYEELWKAFKRFENLPHPNTRAHEGSRKLYPDHFHLNLSRLRVLCRLYREFKNWQQAFEYTWIVRYRQDPEVAAYLRTQVRLHFSGRDADSSSEKIHGPSLTRVLDRMTDDDEWQTHFWQLHEAFSDALLSSLEEELDISFEAEHGESGLRLIKQALIKHAQGKRGKMVSEREAFYRSRFEMMEEDVSKAPDIDEQLKPSDLDPEKRIETVRRILKANRLVMLKGKPGTGKSYMLPELAQAIGYQNGEVFGPFTTGSDVSEYELLGHQIELDGATHDADGPVGAWAGSPRGILFWDEANLSPNSFSSFLEGMALDEPFMWLHGRQFPLKDHAAVLTGNDETVAGRHPLSIVEEEGVTIPFDDFEGAFLEQTLMEYLKNYAGNPRETAGLILRLHDLFGRMNPDNDFSIRELQEAASRAIYFAKDGDASDIIFQTWLVYRGRFNPEEQEALRYILSRKFGVSIQKMERARVKTVQRNKLGRELENSGIAMVDETADFVSDVEDKLILREARLRGEVSTPVKASGVILGPSGWGKDDVVEKILQAHAKALGNGQPFVNGDLEDGRSAAPEQRYYLVNGSMNYERLIECIRRAKQEGSVVILREMNFLPTGILEGKLNDVLTGAAHPGFLFIGTMNDANFTGRHAISSPFLSRSWVTNLSSHPADSLETIAQTWVKNHGWAIYEGTIKGLVLFHKWVETDVKDPQYKPTTRELFRTLRQLGEKSASTLEEAIQMVYGPVFLNWQLGGQDAGTLIREVSIKGILETHFAKEVAIANLAVVLQKIARFFLPPSRQGIEIAFHEKDAPSYYDARKNRLVISSLALQSGNAVDALFMLLGSQFLSRPEILGARLAESLDAADAGQNDFFSVFTVDDSLTGNDSSPFPLYHDLHNLWVRLSLRHTSLLPYFESTYLSYDEADIAEVLKKRDTTSLHAMILGEKGKPPITERQFFRYLLILYGKGVLTRDGISSLKEALEKNPPIVFESNPAEEALKALAAMNSLMSETPQSLHEEEIKYRQWRAYGFIVKIGEIFNSVPTTILEKTREEVIRPSASGPSLAEAVNEFQSEMDARSHAPLDEAEKADAAMMAEENSRAVEARKEEIFQKVKDQIEEELQKIEDDFKAQDAQEAVITRERLDEMKAQLTDPKHPHSIIRWLRWLEEKFSSDSARKPALEQLKERMRQLQERIDQYGNWLSQAENMANAYREAADGAGGGAGFSDGSSRSSGRSRIIGARYQAGRTILPDGMEGELERFKPLDEADLVIPKPETVQESEAKIEPVASSQKQHPRFKKIRNQYRQILEEKALAFYRWFTDSGVVLGGEGDIDVETLLRTRDMAQSRRSLGGVLKQEPYQLVIKNGGTLTPFQEEIFEFLFELGFEVSVLLNDHEVVTEITSLPVFRGALQKARTEKMAADNQTLARTVRRQGRVLNPLILSLGEIQEKIEGAYLYGAFRLAESGEKDEESKAKTATPGQIPDSANQKLILLENGDIVQIGTGKIITQDTPHSTMQTQKIEGLGNGYYLETVKGNSKTFQRLLRLDPTGSWLVQEAKAEKIYLTPDKKYVHALPTADPALFSLETGKTYYLDSDFSTTRLPKGERAKSISNPQFTADGKYLTYLETDKLGWNFLVVIDLSAERKKVKSRIPVGEGNIDYAINPFANHIVFLELPDSSLFLIDLERPQGGMAVFKYAEHLRTDSTGTYTVIVDHHDKMSVYVHKAQKILTASHFGLEIKNVITYWQDGKAGFAVNDASGRDNAKYFNEKGEVSPTTRWNRHGEDSYAEIHQPDRLLFRDTQARVRSSGIFMLAEREALDPLQRLSGPGVYKHPKFDLLIDNHDPKNPVAIDPKTGKQFGFSGEIVSYELGSMQFGSDVSISRQGGVLQVSGKDIKMHFSGIVGKNHFVIQNTWANRLRDGYYLQEINKASAWKHLERIDPETYPEVSFDGRYFVFSNPKTGDVVYLDPDHPDQPVFIPIQPTAPSSADYLSETKPADAPNRFIAINKPDHSVDVIDSQNQQPLPGTEKFQDSRSATRVNQDTFILERADGTKDLVQVSEQGEVKLKLHPIYYTKLHSISAHSEKAVVVSDAKSARVVNVRKWDSFPTSGTSKRVELSPSGRFSVHESETGWLVYYDHDEANPTPEIIARAGEYEEYRVHDKADVVISKNSSGEYALFDLANVKVFKQASYIDIDSWGRVVVSKDMKTGRLVMNTFKSRGESSPMAHFVTDVRVASRGEEAFVMCVAPWKGGGTRNFAWHQSSPSAGWKEIPIDDSSLPRFWESYDLEKKTIWDRQTGTTVSKVPPVYYKQHSPTRSDSPLVLSGSVVHYFRQDGEHRDMFLRDLVTWRSFEIYGATRNEKFLPMRGGSVWYETNAQGDILGIISFDIGSDIIAGSLNVRLKNTVIDQRRAFILGQEVSRGPSDGRVLLFDLKGNAYDLTGMIPEGLAPIEANGKYFVLADPKKPDKILFFDPNAFVANPSHKPMAPSTFDWPEEPAAASTPEPELSFDEQVERIREFLRKNKIPEEYLSFDSAKGEIELDLAYSSVTDLSGLEGLTKLTGLYLVNAPVSDIDVLRSLTGLKNLEVVNAPVSDISALQNLTALRYLNLNYTQVSNVGALRDLKKLEHLTLDNTQVSDVSALQGLTRLCHLSLYNTPVSDISALYSLMKLHFLNLNATKVPPGQYRRTRIELRNLGIKIVDSHGALLKHMEIVPPASSKASEEEPVSVDKFLRQLLEGLVNRPAAMQFVRGLLRQRGEENLIPHLDAMVRSELRKVRTAYSVPSTALSELRRTHGAVRSSNLDFASLDARRAADPDLSAKTEQVLDRFAQALPPVRAELRREFGKALGVDLMAHHAVTFTSSEKSDVTPVIVFLPSYGSDDYVLAADRIIQGKVPFVALVETPSDVARLEPHVSKNALLMTEIDLAQIMKRVPKNARLIAVGDGSEADREYFGRLVKIVEARKREYGLEPNSVYIEPRIFRPDQLSFLSGLADVAETLRSELRAFRLQAIAA